MLFSDSKFKSENCSFCSLASSYKEMFDGSSTGPPIATVYIEFRKKFRNYYR